MPALRVKSTAKNNMEKPIKNTAPIVTVLTPTYNRAQQLIDLYDSLSKQSCRSFLWLVIDDGSTDNTEDTVKALIEKSDFDIEYIKKENGGKHTALNVGISKINTPLTFIVDSDDTLTADAVKVIELYHYLFADDKCICGFSFLRQFPDGKINGNLFPEDGWKETYINARINANDMSSDKAEVYKTEILKEFPFPEFSGEKFLGEDIVWIRMARKYKTVHINKPIYIGEYQTDGLTKNRRRHNLLSPCGCTARAKEYLHKDICFEQRVKATLQYMIYGRVAGYGYKKLFNETPDKLLCFLLTLPALIIQIHWSNSIKKYD